MCFDSSSYSVEEGGAATVTVELSHRSSHVISIPIEVETSSTAESMDYKIDGLSSTGRLIFINRSTSETFTVRTTDDEDYEADETVKLKFGTLPSTVTKTDSPCTTTLTIENDDPAPNVPPTIDDGDSSVSYGECRTGLVETYSATDPDGDSISWSLRGTDRNDFDISSSGVLTFDETPDYEDPDDRNRDNEYEVTVRASDGNGGSDDRDVTVTVTNRAPTIDDGDSSTSYAERGTRSVERYSASDPCGGSITWSLRGDDRNDFDISSSGVLTFDETPDYEDPEDLDRDNEYEITVRASDGSFSDDIDVTITVTDVNESPDINGDFSPSYDEGGTGTVATYTADDPEGGDITWSLRGTDRNDFDISEDGELTFDDTPDYEDPDDSNDDNIYQITVRASDGSLTTSTNVTVTVTNLAPTIDSGRSSVSYAEGGTDAVETYVASDPGGGAITWSLPNTSFETDRDDFEISDDGELTFEEIPDHGDPDDHNDDNVYKITVRASDGRLTASRNVTVTVTDRGPKITSGRPSVSYAEGGTGTVETYTATVPDDGEVTWSLPDTDFETDRDDFEISDDGELTFAETPDYENPDDHNEDNVYKITVRASDDSGDSDDRNVTVTVTNLAPTIGSARPSISYAENRTVAVATYSASDPGGGTISWSLPSTIFETDRGDFDISDNGQLTFKDAPDYEDPDDHNDDNVYKITVRASDDSGSTDDFDVTITVTDVNESPEITGLSSVSYAENGTRAVAMYTADDPEGDEITWRLPNTHFQSDRLDFNITAHGDLRFNRLPNYENPHDENTDNVYKVTVRAVDDDGNTDDIDVTIEVTNVNEEPEVDEAIEDQTITVGASATISLSGTFSDPDGDTLTYTASSSATRVATTSINAIDSTLTLTAVSVGSATITVTAADRASGHADRLEVTDDFTVTVEAGGPAKVTRLSGEPGTNHGEIDLKWNAADDATGYQVRQKESGTNAWIVLPADGFGVEIDGVTAVVSNLDPDKTYDYQVRATNVNGEGEWSDAITRIAVRDKRPDKPTNLKAKDMIGGRGIELSWHPVHGAGGYRVEGDPSVNQDQIVIIVMGSEVVKAQVVELTPGTDYTFEVFACQPCSTPPLYSAPAEVEWEAPLPTADGHQADHTVAYMEDEITSAPNSPDGVPDAAAVIKAAIKPAAAAWNSAIATEIPDKDLKICEVGECGGSNSDGGIVTIETQAANPKYKDGVLGEPCGDSVACVDYARSEAGHYFDHLTDLTIIIEEPAWRCPNLDTLTNTCEELVRTYWTHDSDLDWQPIDEDDLPVGSPSSEFQHIGRVMIHELGHTLGLPDFYADNITSLNGFRDNRRLPNASMLWNAVMHWGSKINAEDLKQLKAIYLLHEPH